MSGTQAFFFGWLTPSKHRAYWWLPRYAGNFYAAFNWQVNKPIPSTAIVFPVRKDFYL